MKYKSLKFLFVVALLAIVGAVVSFKVNISLKPNTALASGPTCSDGAATCGSFGGYMVPGSISCSINGRMNNGQTATCNTADGTTVIGGPGQQEWLVLNKTGSVVVPSTLPAPDANYNSTTVFSNTAINIDWGANQAGTVHIGTAYDSYDPCSPYAIGKIGCNGFSGEISPNGTANPGDVLSMTVTALHADNNMNSTCTPGTNCGQWGAGTASVALSDITYCFKSSSPSNNNYIIPGNSSSGKRNYVTTADGVCTPNNVPVAVPTLTAHWNSGTSTTTTDNVTVGQPYTGNFVFSNSGQAGSSVTVTGCDVIKSDSTFNTSFPPCSGTYSAGGSGGSASITVTSPSSGTPNVQVVVHGVDTANANSTFSQTLTLNITAPVTPPSGTISISNPSSLSCSAPCSPTIQWSSSHVVNGVQIFRGPTFWGNQAGNTSSSSTDYGPGNLGLSAGSYQYCIFAVDASWNDVTPALMCTTLTVTAPTTYTVSTSAGAGGSISPSSQTVNSGQTTTFTVTPLTNYSISSVSGCNGSLSSSIYTTGAIIANCTVTASFSSSATLPTVTTSSISNIGQTTATGGGTITSNGGATVTVSGIVWSNTTTYPTTTNYLGITYDGWSIGGPWIDNISGLKANTSYYVRAYATNSVGTAYDGSYVPFTTIAAAPTTYTVSTSAGAGGSISPSSQTVNSGSTTILTVFPNSGYNTSSASGCGGSLSGNTYYTGAITANCTVTASFTASTTLPNVTTSSISNIGQTTATGGGTINSNGGATVTQSGIVWSNTTSSPTTSNYSGINTYGYAIGGPWSDVMTGLTAGTTYYVRAYATNSVGTAYGNYVSFTTTAAPPTTYTVTPSAGYGGSISPGTQQTVNSGSSLTFNINPSSGYSISNVLVDSSPVGAVGSYTFSNITTNHTISASFTLTSVMSGTLLPLNPTCTITEGGNSCTQLLTWTTTNPVATSAVTSPTGTPSPGTSANNSSQTFTVPYNASGVNFFLYNNGGSPLAQTNVTTSCATNTTWNGSSCVANSCANGAVNYPTCTINSGGNCLNGANNPATCTTFSIPTVTTATPNPIAQTTATGGGTITSTGGTITVSGIVWSTSVNPTYAGGGPGPGQTTDGHADTSPWTDSITGLSASTTYHVRAYAVNSAGTGYGADVQFTTLSPAPVVGVCGTGSGFANGKTYPYPTSSYGSDVQCSVGTSNNTTFPAAGGTAYWTCSGLNGGGDSGTCSASQGAAPAGASCSATHYNCITGTSSKIAGDTTGDTATFYKWNCNAAGGNVSCSEYKLKKPVFIEK